MPIRPLVTRNMANELFHHGFRRVGEYGFNFKAPLQSDLPLFRTGQPYRLAEGRLLVVHRGEIDMELDLVEHHLKMGDIAMAMPDSLAMPIRIGDDCVVSIVTFTRLPNDNGRQECFVTRCDEDTLLRIEQFINMITMQLKRPNEYGEIMSRLFDAFILDVQSLSSEIPAAQSDTFMHRFLQLLSKEGQVKHPIEFYADRLCITSGYLSTLVKQHSGMTALQWIDRSLVREAKVLLHHTQMPIAEVADILGFATPSFFVRFFRQQTGSTPLQFRKKNNTTAPAT